MLPTRWLILLLIHNVDISSHGGTQDEINLGVVLRPESDPDTSDSDRDYAPDSYDRKTRKADPHPESAVNTKRAKHTRRGSGRMHSGIQREAPAVTPHTAAKATDDFGDMVRSTNRFFDRQEAAATVADACSSSSSSNNNNNYNNNNYTFQEMMALEELRGKNLALQQELLKMQQKHGL